VLKATSDVEPSADFLSRVRRRVDDEKEEQERGGWGFAAWATVAAIFVGLVVGALRAPQSPRLFVGENVTLPTLVPTTMITPAPREPRVAAATPRVHSPQKNAPSRSPEVLIDPRAGEALARYAEAMRSQKGAIAESLEARVAPMDELPRYRGVLLESTAATRDLPRVSVLTDLPIFERTEL
jgi:hypothetical protein